MKRRWMWIGVGAGSLLTGALYYHAHQPVFLEYAELKAANLAHRQWSKARLSSADLRSANLQHADLRGADLSQACMENADLRNADLRNAKLWAANVSGADLRGARLDGADVRLAMFTRDTRWPPEFHAERRHWYPVSGYPGYYNLSFKNPEPLERSPTESPAVTAPQPAEAEMP